jgi:hypothetical protein
MMTNTNNQPTEDTVMTTSTATLYRYDHYEASYGYDTEFHPTIDDAIKSHGVDSALLVDGTQCRSRSWPRSDRNGKGWQCSLS